MDIEYLEKRVRESGDLADRLDECRGRLAKMCSERRPPNMTVPVQWNDDDFYIVTTVKDAIREIKALRARLAKIEAGPTIRVKWKVFGDEQEKHAAMLEPTFDELGYPTDETLDAIMDWDDRDPRGLMEFCRKAWRYPERFSASDGDEGETIYELSTGGWSGNEEIIEALQDNIMFWCRCWVQSRRGGHYIFSVQQE